jgi:hypothetical protein
MHIKALTKHQMDSFVKTAEELVQKFDSSRDEDIRTELRQKMWSLFYEATNLNMKKVFQSNTSKYNELCSTLADYLISDDE